MLNIDENFVGGAVGFPVKEGLKDVAPLYRQRDAARTAQPFEFLQSVTLE
jgi:hypothetical protein